ncbi:hypothetical protein CapIbe_009796 [Capra ibex]
MDSQGLDPTRPPAAERAGHWEHPGLGGVGAGAGQACRRHPGPCRAVCKSQPAGLTPLRGAPDGSSSMPAGRPLPSLGFLRCNISLPPATRW